jgi:hypothetical protein
MKHLFPFRKVYGPVLVLAVITMYGLLSALFGDGVWDEIACVFLAIPLAVIVWKYSRATRRE